MQNDVDYQSFNKLITENKLTVVLVYTSFCGTCAKAKQMLEIVSMSLGEIQYLQINGGTQPIILEEYQITSIPCFLILENGKLLDQFYAFNSVTFLYEKLTKYLNKPN